MPSPGSLARKGGRPVTIYAGVEGLSKDLRRLGKVGSDYLKDEAQAMANDIASAAATRAFGLGGAAAIVAPTIRSRRDRIPFIVVGSTKLIRTSTKRKRTKDDDQVAHIVAGAEFGGSREIAGDSPYRRSTTLQFRPHKGQEGYFLWPTIRDMNPDVTERWVNAYDAAMTKSLDGG